MLGPERLPDARAAAPLGRTDALAQLRAQVADAGADLVQAGEALVHATCDVLGTGATLVLLGADGVTLDQVLVQHRDEEVRDGLAQRARTRVGSRPVAGGFLESLLLGDRLRVHTGTLATGSLLEAALGPRALAHLVGVRIDSRSGTVGALVAWRGSELPAYRISDAALLESLAATLQVAVESARASRHQDRAVQQAVAALREQLAPAAGLAPGLAPGLAQTQAAAVRAATDHSAAVLLLPGPRGSAPRFGFAHAQPEVQRLLAPLLAGWHAQHPPPLLQRALDDGDYLANDQPEEVLRDGVGPTALGLSLGLSGHVAAARIVDRAAAGGGPLGVLSLHREGRATAFDRADLSLVRALADVLADLLTDPPTDRPATPPTDRTDSVAARPPIPSPSAAPGPAPGARPARSDLHEVLDALPVMLLILDAGGRVELANDQLSGMLHRWDGLTRALDDAAGFVPGALRLVGTRTDTPSLLSLAEGLMQVLVGESTRYEADVFAEPGGQGHWLHCIVVPRGNGGAILTIDDVTERRNAEVEAAHRATHDPLTGLPNRALLTDRLEHAVARSMRHGGTLAVLFIDLDHFKQANDTHGHGFGDELLVRVVERLVSATRPEDTLARFGGDEFVLLCEDLESPDDAVVVAHRVLQSLEEPLVVQGTELRQSASLGLAVSDGPTDTTTLLAEADGALFLAKDRGRAQLAVHERDGLSTGRRAELADSLHEALASGDLELHFQPVVSLPDGAVLGAEALLRWNRGGILLPAKDFLDDAEGHGLTVPVGRWVLKAACQQAARWRVHGETSRVFVNISAAHLAGGLEHDVRQALDSYGLPASALSLELTEASLAEDPPRSLRTLRILQGWGVGVQVDDFGTGWSSIAHLRELAPQSLKIDQRLVAGVHLLEHDRAVVKAAISLAHGLGITTTAEGIESGEQLRTLIALGCDAGQGFLLRYPEPAGVSWPMPRALLGLV